jgi:hypothetical protein
MLKGYRASGWFQHGKGKMKKLLLCLSIMSQVGSKVAHFLDLVARCR